jgi:hypothetical protein
MSVLGTTLAHEEVHKLIFKNFGVDSNLSFSLNELRFFTNANQTDWEGLTNEARQQIKLENSINESIGYNTGNYLIAIMGILLFGFFYLGSKIK